MSDLVALLRIRGSSPLLMRICLVLLIGLCCTHLTAQTSTQSSLSAALHGTSAIGMVVDLRSGRSLAAVGNVEKRSTPGSILKPLFLSAALEQNAITPQATVFCRRGFHIEAAGRDWNVNCTHPQTDVAFSAKEALAYSCNRYFAALADRLTPAQTVAILEHYGIVTRTPQLREQKELLVLGLSGVIVSPRQIATAYRKLLLRADVNIVREALADSVNYGMAHNASVPGKQIEGKTGTANDRGETWSHGWFAGTGLVGMERVILVIYVAHGSGADTARLAQHFFVTATVP